MKKKSKKFSALLEVKNGIEQINNDAGKTLIDSSGSYLKHYKKMDGLPSSITDYFTEEQRTDFIVEYAALLNVDKESVGLWDALLMRPVVVITLKFVQESIKQINDDAGEVLIYTIASYRKHYKKIAGLPSDIIDYFTAEKRADFIAEYATLLNVDKTSVSIWNALFMQPIIDRTLKFVQESIKKINDQAGEIIIDNSLSYIKNHKRIAGLPFEISSSFTEEQKSDFIAEYAALLNVDKTLVSLWDALLMRPIVVITLKFVQENIKKINDDAGDVLIYSLSSYRKHYKKIHGLPSSITRYFTEEQRAIFIAEYATLLDVDKTFLSLWDALLMRPAITLKFVQDSIKKINDNAGEILICSTNSYSKHCNKIDGLPFNVKNYFTEHQQTDFVAEYAKLLNVDKASVGLWDALLMRPAVVITLKFVQESIKKINDDAGEILIDSGSSYYKHYKKIKGLPYQITYYFTKQQRADFIAEYAASLNVDKMCVDLWDALLMRPAKTLKFVQENINKINNDAGEVLIDSVASYHKHYKRIDGLPIDVYSAFTEAQHTDFIAEYADLLSVDKVLIGLWDALLMRPVVAITLEFVQEGINKINHDAGERLIDGVVAYSKHYKKVYGLPCDINRYFTEELRTDFIAKYAKLLGVEKEWVGIWDALLMRPIAARTLTFVKQSIKKINDDADKILINSSSSYLKHYKKIDGLPASVINYSTEEQRVDFIAEYATLLNVDKAWVGLWDALLMRPIVARTLTFVQKSIKKINDDAGEVLIDSGVSYVKHYNRIDGLPSSITECFTENQRADFIAEYAQLLSVDKASVGLWDALCQKSNSKYCLNEIELSHPKWYAYFSCYMDSQDNVPQRERTFKNFIQYFIDEFGYSLNPLVCLAQKKKKIDLNEYECFFSSFGESSKKKFHTIIVEFIDFIIADLSGFDNDTEEDEAPLLSNTFTYFESDILHIKAPKFSESNKPRLAFSYIVKAREWIFPESCNNFRDLKHLHNLVDQDWVEVDKLQINAADLNCVWRHRKKDNKTSRKQDKNSGRSVEFVYEVWMPTRWVMLYTLLQVPIRGVQVSKLDSGEADSYLPIINHGEIEWVDNSSKLNTGTTQSFIKRYPGEHAGMYVTTNKTSSSQGGYAVPYIPFDLCKWIIQFREFQSTYNPLDKPTLWTEIKLRRKTNAKKLKSMGSQCFLFREMGDVTPMNEAVFRNAFAFVLAQIETDDLKLTKKINDNNNLKSYKTVYTPHSLRVSLISAYITDGKIPIEVVSKIVGHHSLMMTIYYTKIGDGKFKYYLEQAEKNMLKASGDNIALELLDKQLENADENLICNTKGGVEQFTTNWPASSYFVSDIGICPMAGTGCNEGGEVIESTKTRLLYAPVERGYLGERNCPRCRFFMTGIAFTPGLAAVMHRIQTECGGVNEKYKEHTINVKILEDEEYDCEQGNVPFTKRLELTKSIQNKEAYATRLNAHKVDIVAIARLVEMSLSLVNQSNSNDKLALVINNDIGEVGVEYNDSSEFKLFDTVCQDSEIYSIVDATNIVPRRTQLIDAMLQANNVNSTLFRMPVQEQLKIGNQVTQLLLKRLGSWDKLNGVAEGRSRLNENSISVVNSSSMKSITKEVQQLIDNAKCSGQQLEVGAAINDDNVIDVKDIK